ncbi:uncharacterized protein LOC129612433 [Condylostylus longicornis]|uniref:uncharacterized protein LOC129612433 n=1 Tax=Condylostylus longicornis TaxID=2530218 RepID=UPI00244DA92C|nr:uncharacterized protein LOC129612433 [Condylostylus longicornis]
MKSYLKNTILSKIQGEAAISIRRLENATWDEIKTQLTKSFGIPESYLKLKEMADAVKFINAIPILSNEKAIKYKIFGLPNSKFELVDIPNSDIVSFKNKTYYLTQERYIKKLQLTSNCISNLFIMAYGDCSKTTEKNYKIEEINKGMILIINAQNHTLKSDCNDITYLLNKNYIIYFSNCTIEINNIKFSNKNKEFKYNIVIPNYTTIKNINNTIKLENLNLKQLENNKEIHEIKNKRKFNENLTYFNTIFVIIMLFILIILTYMLIKTRKEKPLNNINKIDSQRFVQENKYLKDGGVIYPTNEILSRIIELNSI